MKIYDGLLVALFGMVVVFVVLIALSLFIRLESAIVSALLGKHSKEDKVTQKSGHMDALTYKHSLMDSMSGELKLSEVDDELAAVITAAVVHEGRTIGKNLVIKSIKPYEL